MPIGLRIIGGRRIEFGPAKLKQLQPEFTSEYDFTITFNGLKETMTMKNLLKKCVLLIAVYGWTIGIKCAYFEKWFNTTNKRFSFGLRQSINKVHSNI